MRVLFIGDVVGKPGRQGSRAAMPELREQHAPDLVIVNGENSAGGLGITEKTAKELFDAGRRRDHDSATTSTATARSTSTSTATDRDHPAGQLSARQPGPRAHRGRGRRACGSAVINLQRPGAAAVARIAVRRGRRAARAAARTADASSSTSTPR